MTLVTNEEKLVRVIKDIPGGWCGLIACHQDHKRISIPKLKQQKKKKQIQKEKEKEEQQQQQQQQQQDKEDAEKK